METRQRSHRIYRPFQESSKYITTSLVVTHQNRLKCLLNSFMDVKYKFGNGSVFEMKFIREKNKIKYQIELVFEGFIKPNKKYYTIPSNTQPIKKNLFPFEKIEGVSNTFLDISVSSLLPNIEYIFILIRHGQATHNQYNIFTKFKSLYNMDTLLTEDGEKQALKVGDFLKDFLYERRLKIDYLFVSDLKRTRQTMTLIIHQIKPENITKMIVLPCSHELSYFNDKNCDKKMINYSEGSLAGENMMRCDIENCDDESNLYCCNVIYGDTKLSVNWIYYMDFYDGGKRKDLYTEETTKSCFDTNMIKNAIHILLLESLGSTLIDD